MYHGGKALSESLDCLQKVVLATMYKRDVRRLVEIGVMIQSFYSRGLMDLAPDLLVPQAEIEGFIRELERIVLECGAIALPNTRALLDAVVCDYRAVPHTNAQLKSTVTCVHNQFQQELKQRTFVQIDPEREGYLMNEEEFTKAPLFGQDVFDAFSSTNGDVRNAGNCYATFRNTACVFHCMRVLEKGLIALAHELNVPFSLPFEYENWQNIIEPIAKAILAFEQGQKKSPYKIETLKQYSEVGSQFFYVKAAWRNHVAHSRDTYDSEQAKAIMDHTGALMRFLVKAGLHD